MVTWPDYLILAAVVGLTVLIGYLAAGKGKSSTSSFFLARRQIPLWAACLAFVAAEVSAMTLISVPATAFTENWEYAQFFIGSTAARFVIAYLFIPAFYHYNCTTIYEYLKHRFGAATQYTATVFFYLTRFLGSGVRLMVAALAVSVLLGWRIELALGLFTLFSVAYVMYGGMRSTIWTGVIQATVYIVAGLAAIGFLLAHTRGGLSGMLAASGPAGRLQVWDRGPSWSDPSFFKKFFTDPTILWIAILNGFFGSMAAFGTDHELMSRLLTVETRPKSQRAMVATPIASGLVLFIYLSVGSCLFAFYSQRPALPLPEKLDAIFPHFIGHVMPAGWRGLMLAAIALASMDTPLASLTASFVTDIYRPLIKPEAEDAHYLLVSRACVGVFATLLALIAYGFSFTRKYLWLAFKIGGVTFGSLLGVFLLGLATRRQANRANIVSMTAMAALNATLLVLSEKGIFPIGWTWLLLIGTAGTMLLSYALGPVLDKSALSSYPRPYVGGGTRPPQ